MAKGQQHGNRETKKPKKAKVVSPAPSPFVKGLSESQMNPKKKT